ncbi:MAG: ImmA/IrrE family metallo-endopeptidase [Dehalococcoidales bacterium]|nr:ImmA/IrrE family metallo-endopeptidase [Dehalococcoidales bacterium]
MDNQTVKKAKELVRGHPGLNFPLDIERLVTEAGCELIEWPFLSPVKEVKQGRWIAVAAGLDHKEQRYLAAHALGHHLLHCGNQLWFRDWQETSVARQEREADEFAAHVLMPEIELEKLDDLKTWEIAEYFGVPEELVSLRLNKFATDRERERWQSHD